MDNSAVCDLRQRVRSSAISQDRLARALGMDRSWLSRILSGKQRMPADFEERLNHALDALENAEAAAEEARRKVMVREGLAS